MQKHRGIEGLAREGRFKRRLLSCFILLNIGTVLFINRPAAVVEVEEGFFQTLDPGIAYELRYSRWALQYYAFIVGLNNQWQMFGDLSRYYLVVHHQGQVRRWRTPGVALTSAK